MQFYRRPPPKPKRPETPERDVSDLLPVTISYHRPGKPYFSYSYYLRDEIAAIDKARAFCSTAKEDWSLSLFVGHVPPYGSEGHRRWMDPERFATVTKDEVRALNYVQWEAELLSRKREAQKRMKKDS